MVFDVATIVTLLICLLSMVVATTDYKQRRIYNSTVVLIALTGVSGHVFSATWPDLIYGLITAVAIVIVLMPLYALGGLGAGDIKYLAATSVWLGLKGTLHAVLLGSISFLVVGFAYLAINRQLVNYLWAFYAKLTIGLKELFKPTEGQIFLPYGVFLALGVIVVLLWG